MLASSRVVLCGQTCPGGSPANCLNCASEEGHFPECVRNRMGGLIFAQALSNQGRTANSFAKHLRPRAPHQHCRSRFAAIGSQLTPIPARCMSTHAPARLRDHVLARRTPAPARPRSRASAVPRPREHAWLGGKPTSDNFLREILPSLSEILAESSFEIHLISKDDFW